MIFYFFFQANFDAPLDLIQGKSVFLNCEGLDTVATVTLNNVEIGRAENMFRRYRFNIGAKYLGVFSPLVPSKREKNTSVLLSYFCSVCTFFEKIVFTFQFSNDKIHNYVF